MINDESLIEEMKGMRQKEKIIEIAALVFCAIAWWWIINTAIAIVKNIQKWF